MLLADFWEILISDSSFVIRAAMMTFKDVLKNRFSSLRKKSKIIYAKSIMVSTLKHYNSIKMMMAP